jgi:hypothetical protein
MQEYKKASEKQRLFRQVNSGEVRILIGSSETMGTGVNAQRRLIALHHLDPNYLPALILQREGRIMRQGNQNAEVWIYVYVTVGSMDSTMWQILERKMRFIDAAFQGDLSVRRVDDVDDEADSFAMAKAMASGDDRLMRKAGIEMEAARLQRQRAAHYDEQALVRREINFAGEAIERYGKRVAALEADRSRAVTFQGDEFLINVEGVDYTDKKAGGAAIMQSLSNEALEGNGRNRSWTIATYRGFPLQAEGWLGYDENKPVYRQRVRIEFAGEYGTLYKQDFSTGVTMIDRANREISEIASELSNYRALLAEARRRLADFQSKRSDEPFPLQAELDLKLAQIAEIEESLRPKEEPKSPKRRPPNGQEEPEKAAA